MLELRTNVHDLSEEVANLNARRSATERLVAALDRQLATINTEVDAAAQNTVRTEGELGDKRATLKRRLVDIYKRGPLFTAEALLSAQSFGELVARYKYLHTLALHDRALVARVEQLRDQLARDRDRLVHLQEALEQNRNDKRMEQDNLRDLEHERESKLAEAQLTARRTEQNLDRLRRTEAQLASTIASFEAERRRSEGRATTIPAGSPYRGLAAFDGEHSALFFGRDAEVRTILERLRTDAFVLVARSSTRTAKCKQRATRRFDGMASASRHPSVRQYLPSSASRS